MADLHSTPFSYVDYCSWEYQDTPVEPPCFLKLFDVSTEKHSVYGVANDFLGLEELIKEGTPGLQSLF